MACLLIRPDPFMHEHRNPSDIAREALKSLAIRHLAPTPANYQACYNEIAGLPNVTPFPEAGLKQVAEGLVPHSEAQRDALAQLDMAIAGRSWQGVLGAIQAFCVASPVQSVGENTLLPKAFAATLHQLLACMLPALGGEDARFAEATNALLALLKAPACEIQPLDDAVRKLVSLAGYVVEEHVELRTSLLNLLHLIIQNIGDLSIDDHWFKGQIDGLLAAVDQPLSLRHLDDVERRLRDVIDKQSRAKVRSVEAQEEMRQMLAAFIESLSAINESSTSFQGRIEESARQIEQVTRIEDLAPLLKDVVSASRAMADEAANSREQLKTLQDKVLTTEAELVQLHVELDNASALARHDPLTDVLNRKGLDEALEREIAAVRRRATALSICLLDIDNFKKLNDSLGHQAGDEALIHLTKVARACMRPSDTLARYGGEEFVILMPDTQLPQGIEAMTRLQRELTKAFFMSGKDKVLITFSAGVAQLGNEETGGEAIRRADEAMYLAKRTGKNRVLGA